MKDFLSPIESVFLHGFPKDVMDQQVAVIHIGGSSVSMLIAERTRLQADAVRTLEVLEQPLSLADNVFEKAAISRTTIERCVTILSRFREALADYGLSLSGAVRVLGTNILSEASNRDQLLRRIRVACGVDVEILDEGDMTRLIYIQAERLLKSSKAIAGLKTILVVHVGPGNTRILLFSQGRIVKYTSYRMGGHRVAEAVDQLSSSARWHPEVIRGHINGSLEQIELDYEGLPVDGMVLLGKELQSVAGGLGVKKKDSGMVSLSKLKALVERIADTNQAEVSQALEIDYEAASVMVAVLQCNVSIAERFKISSLVVPGDSFEGRLLSDIAGADFSTKRLEKEIIQSCTALALKYRVDMDHAGQVERLCVTLFEDLRKLHGLNDRDRLLLRAAAILHESGLFVSRKIHHKHSYYLIRNSEVFGLNDTEVEIVALVSRYHRRSAPNPSHVAYRMLDLDTQMRVSKLAALLRLADALERCHTQRINVLKATVRDDELVLYVGALTDVSVEELALKSKAGLFTELFGLHVILETG